LKKECLVPEHGEQLVVLLVGDEVLVRAEQLDPHQQGHDPGA
jgi:hypothetical protein